MLENQHKRSIGDDIGRLNGLMPWIADVPLERIHLGVLQSRVEHRREEGVATGTINHGLKIIRRILNLAASEWLDEHGLTWLAAAPKIKLLPDTHTRRPYPLNCDERLVVLNDVAKSVVNARRGQHPTHVFAFRGKPTARMLNSAWLRARKAAGLDTVRVHDLKHTFGRRLRAAGVSFEDRQDLLGHRSGRMTTHYSAAELTKLIEAANSVCERDGNRPELVVLRRLSIS